MRRALLLLIASAAFAQAPKLTWDAAVSEFYRTAAVASALDLQAHRAHDAAGEALERVKAACDGTVEGVDRLQVTCKAK